MPRPPPLQMKRAVTRQGPSGGSERETGGRLEGARKLTVTALSEEGTEELIAAGLERLIGVVGGCPSGAGCPDANSLSAGFGGGTWRSHVVHAGVTYEAPWGVQLASTYTFQTGPWSGPIQARIAAVDPGIGAATLSIDGRTVSNPLAGVVRFAYPTRADGQFRLDALHLWNLRVGRSWAIGASRLALSLDVLNVINHDADQTFQAGGNQLFSPFFGQGSNRQFPRAFQASARFTF